MPFKGKNVVFEGIKNSLQNWTQTEDEKRTAHGGGDTTGTWGAHN